MALPILHANPTELVSTLPTSHVVTALILFNPGAAFGASFGICQYPISCFGLITTLFIPTCQISAVRG
eukprot:CAMPEP_0194140246 /NCGR_PEP_ID=MMETSP0152-20130528/9806_1 /TAXON_ID=1049557 /ORGANISM="Thalassiothrix antarctica, Strain L6-D1" /LENGTH=67 /DNA_ID=CAMNT_0038838417 /DNA_START=430 /DNA_END=633 /DNA_ORIENTATION=+